MSSLPKLKTLVDSLTFWGEDARDNVFALCEELLRDDDNDGHALTDEDRHLVDDASVVTKRDIIGGIAGLTVLLLGMAVQGYVEGAF